MKREVDAGPGLCVASRYSACVAGILLVHGQPAIHTLITSVAARVPYLQIAAGIPIKAGVVLVDGEPAACCPCCLL